uniref:Uncharacterized protein n=1 Tax=Lygus hesperus TaxID=30085 RepID=A0A0A9YVN3_LYGHE
MSTKKTALTMTDSERCFVESHDPDLPDDFPKSMKDENYMLKIVVEEQKIALDMIMRKYREQTDRLTRLSQIDLRKLHYQRYLQVIVNQMNKMDNMTKTMRKNLLVIFKYEELMRDLEAENARLRELVKALSAASIKSKKEIKQCSEVSSQTDILFAITMEHKSVGSESPISRRTPQNPINEPSRIGCTEMVPYVPINYDFGDAGLQLTEEPTTADLSYNEACEVFFSRFAAADISEGISSTYEGTTDRSRLIRVLLQICSWIWSSLKTHQRPVLSQISTWKKTT